MLGGCRVVEGCCGVAADAQKACWGVAVDARGSKRDALACARRAARGCCVAPFQGVYSPYMPWSGILSTPLEHGTLGTHRSSGSSGGSSSSSGAAASAARRRLHGQPACSPLTARRQPEDSRRQPRGQPNDSRRQLDDSATTARRPATPAPAPAPASAPAAATRSSVLSLCSGCVLQHTPGAQSSRIHSNAARTGAAAAAATAAAAAPTAPADPAPPSFFLYVVRLCSDSHRVPRCEQ